MTMWTAFGEPRNSSVFGAALRAIVGMLQLPVICVALG